VLRTARRHRGTKARRADRRDAERLRSHHLRLRRRARRHRAHDHAADRGVRHRDGLGGRPGVRDRAVQGQGHGRHRRDGRRRTWAARSRAHRALPREDVRRARGGRGGPDARRRRPARRARRGGGRPGPLRRLQRPAPQDAGLADLVGHRRPLRRHGQPDDLQRLRHREVEARPRALPARVRTDGLDPRPLRRLRGQRERDRGRGPRRHALRGRGRADPDREARREGRDGDDRALDELLPLRV
jgi:hypothetical protein